MPGMERRSRGAQGVPLHTLLGKVLNASGLGRGRLPCPELAAEPAPKPFSAPPLTRIAIEAPARPPARSLSCPARAGQRSGCPAASHGPANVVSTSGRDWPRRPRPAVGTAPAAAMPAGKEV